MMVLPILSFLRNSACVQAVQVDLDVVANNVFREILQALHDKFLEVVYGGLARACQFGFLKL